MTSCWKFIPEDRPRFSALVKQLSQQQSDKSQSTEHVYMRTSVHTTV